MDPDVKLGGLLLFFDNLETVLGSFHRGDVPLNVVAIAVVLPEVSATKH